MKKKEIAILIVDNDAPRRKMLATFLGGSYNCTTAATAEKAIALLTFWSFDLVITDQDLPGVSGLGLCQFVNKTRPGTAVILLTGQITQWHRTVAESLGVFDCLGRPCDLTSLLDLVQRALFSKVQEMSIEIGGPVHGLYQTT